MGCCCCPVTFLCRGDNFSLFLSLVPVFAGMTSFFAMMFFVCVENLRMFLAYLDDPQIKFGGCYVGFEFR